MKQEILHDLLDIIQTTEAAIQAFNNDKEQHVLEFANDIRNKAWNVKETIFKTRFLENSINTRSVKLIARARNVSTSLDDLLDLL